MVRKFISTILLNYVYKYLLYLLYMNILCEWNGLKMEKKEIKWNLKNKIG